VVVALAVELAGTGKFMPSLEVLGYGLVQQSPLGVARVVGLGFGARLPARMRMRLRWACGGGHGAVPAWAGCLMILVLYPASSQAEPTTGRANTPDLIASCAHFTRAVARFGSHTDAQPVPHHRATTIAARHLSLSWWVSPTPFILSLSWATTLNSPTDGTYLARALQQQSISIRGARTHNLKNSITLYNTVCRTACSQRSISSWARGRSSVGKKRRSERHKSVSSSVFW